MQPKTRHLASQCVEDAPFGGSHGRETTKARRLLLTVVCSGVKIKYVCIMVESAVESDLKVLKWAQEMGIHSQFCSQPQGRARIYALSAAMRMQDVAHRYKM